MTTSQNTRRVFIYVFPTSLSCLETFLVIVFFPKTVSAFSQITECFHLIQHETSPKWFFVSEHEDVMLFKLVDVSTLVPEFGAKIFCWLVLCAKVICRDVWPNTFQECAAKNSLEFEDRMLFGGEVSNRILQFYKHGISSWL